MTHGSPPAVPGRRIVGRVVLRAVTTATLVIALYYVIPLRLLAEVPVTVPLLGGILLLLAWAAWLIRSIVNATNPTIRAIEAISVYLSVFLVVFATGYYVMAQADSGNFNLPDLTRTDTLYFTLTVFSTVGFGDINATSQVARIVVMVQIILNLILLGAGVRLLTQAVHLGAARRQAELDAGGTETQSGAGAGRHVGSVDG